MSRIEWTKDLFKAIDNLNAKNFKSFLTDDATFRLGNMNAVNGKEEIGEMVGGFFDSIKGIRHELIEVWELPDTIICQGNATYIRKDSSELTVPFSNILKLDKNLINDYQVYVDISQLYKPVVD